MKGLSRFFSNHRNTGYLMGTLCFFALLWLVIAPLVSIGIHSFQLDSGAWTTQNWVNIGLKENASAIGNSLLLGLYVTLISSALALPSAWILAKTPLRKCWWIDLLLMVVFMVPPYINSTGWLYFMGKNGLLVQLIPQAKAFADSYISIWGLALTMSFHSYPFLLTIMKNAIISIPQQIDDSLDVYCRSKFKRVFNVYAPILLPNFFIGCFLVFVKVLAEYGSPAMFAYKLQIKKIFFPVFTTLLTDYMTVTSNIGQASSMAFILIFICMFLWMLQSFAVSKRTYTMKNGSKSKTRGKVITIILSSLFLLILFFISTIIPLGTIIAYSFTDSISLPVGLNNTTFNNYVNAFETDGGFGTGLDAFGHSFYISILGSLFATIAGLVFAIFAYRHKKRQKAMGKTVETMALIPEMLPNIVMAIGFIMLYNTIKSPIYRTPWMLILAYAIIFLPNSVSYAKSSLLSLSDTLAEAGDVYCKSRLKVDLRILVPATLKNVFYGFAMSFIVAMRELVVAKILQPPSYYVISTFIDSQFNQGDQLVGMAMSVVTLLVTFIILFPLQGIFMNEGKKKAKKNKLEVLTAKLNVEER